MKINIQNPKQFFAKSAPIRLSVCMAVYNGAEFLEQQLNSILPQLGLNDEIVICDDKSTDRSVDIISSFEDPRIVLSVNDNQLGHVKNFEIAISLARGNYIFLSDQDDIWVSHRLYLYIEKLYQIKSPALVVGNFIEVDNKLLPLDTRMNRLKLAGSEGSRLPIALMILMGRSKYYGCCFAFHRSLNKLILPFPSKIEAHDMWIGLVSSLCASVAVIDEVTLLRRIHDKNITPKRRRGWKAILLSRVKYVLELIFLLIRIRLGKL